MAVKVIMPKLGMAMTEGTVVKWLKPDGARVEKGERIAVVMSKKITYEVEAPASGILRHAAAEKEVKPVGEVIAYIAEPGEVIPELEKVPAAPPVAEAPAPPPKEILATPAAKRLAKEHGIDLAQVTGTGPGGRITEKDVMAFIEARKAPPPPPRPPAKVIPFIGMRQAIAERMTQSLQTMAQVTITAEIDATELVRMREQLKGEFELTYTDMVVKAAAMALKKHPLLNSALIGEEIHLLEEIHIGVAVALEGGLIVPVVRDADKKSLKEIASETRRLAEGARAGTLTVDEVTGSTFTVTNLGMYGVDIFTPIINPPEVAILGVGRIVEKPACYQGQIVSRAMMHLSLTFDHRIVDGAPAAEFLRTVKELLENPYRLLL
ncbi:MAG: dihydrolipoamide acetyltransferase family protein [Anaerolineae bacterium]|nr:2-oxo acid dehydrogenase subunit E2 [Anaerolineae bacterium]MDW8101496.1 dihydrolipoamide acetyltransferase family protein [Anaerolineae bacterium]